MPQQGLSGVSSGDGVFQHDAEGSVHLLPLGSQQHVVCLGREGISHWPVHQQAHAMHHLQDVERQSLLNHTHIWSYHYLDHMQTAHPSQQLSDADIVKWSLCPTEFARVVGK